MNAASAWPRFYPGSHDYEIVVLPICSHHLSDIQLKSTRICGSVVPFWSFLVFQKIASYAIDELGDGQTANSVAGLKKSENK
jgi:hypothetical protein